MGHRSRTKTVLLISFLVIVWGASWPIYKVSLDYTPPLLFAGMRTFLGGLLLALVLLPRRNQIRFKETWPVYCIAAFFNVIIFNGLQTIGLLYLPSGLYAVIVYLQPVLVGFFAWLWIGEPISAVKIIGLLIGFLGVGTVSADGFSGEISLFGIILALLTALGYALGTVYAKKVSGQVDSMWLVAWQFMIGGAVLSALGGISEHFSDIVWNGAYVSGLLFGAILGIPTAWVVYLKLVNAGEASKVTSYTFLVPLVSVLIGTTLLGEPFTLNLLLGLVLIVLSIWLVNRKVNARIRTEKKPLQKNAYL
jgi:drug/metabolite transporter (DMT)-like permease